MGDDKATDLISSLGTPPRVSRNISFTPMMSPPHVSLPFYSPSCDRPYTREITSSPRKRTTSTTYDRVLQTGAKTLYIAGRPPWYDEEGSVTEPYLIGICGGSASGKTTVANAIISELDVPWVAHLSMDSFYKILSEEEHDLALCNEYNFDCPNAFDIDLLIDTLCRLKEGKQVDIPVYNFTTHSREKSTKIVYGANIIIFEGIMAFCDDRVLEMMNIKIFVDTDPDIRLMRRLQRDISERGRDLDGVLKQYFSYVKPAYDLYIEPRMKEADLIVPKGGENEIAIDLIVKAVQNEFHKRGRTLRGKLGERQNKLADHHLPSQVKLLENSKHNLMLQTFLRNTETARDDFIFYARRLMRLLFELAMSLLPYEDKTLTDPDYPDVEYNGKQLAANAQVCGISILRAGETMELMLCEVCKDVILGKILIQTNQKTGDPELYYLRLPKDIQKYHVFVMDPTVASGAAAIMAIRVLLEHDVPQKNILLVSLLMASLGAHNVAYAYPDVKIVTTAVDPEIDENFHIIPGLGNFGDRYFGTDASSDLPPLVSEHLTSVF